MSAGAASGVRRLRAGELIGLAGVALIVVSMLEPWYEGMLGRLSAWDTFGPAVVLLLAAACAGLAMVVSALTERTPALPVAAAVWCVPVGLMALIAAVVRVLERPDHSTTVCLGAWLALAGAAAVLVGAWLAIRDERPFLYQPAEPTPRPRP